jgi:hypothetical protein
MGMILLSAVQPTRLLHHAFAGAAALACATAASADNAPLGTSQMTTLLEFPINGFSNGNMVADTQGGFYVPWVDATKSQLEVLDVRSNGTGQWTIVATSPKINSVYTSGPSLSYLAPDGTGGVNLVGCTEKATFSDVIANVHPSGGALAVTNYSTAPDLTNSATPVCQYNGITTSSPSLFFVSNSYQQNGVNTNGVQQVAVAGGQGTLTPITLPGGANFDTIIGANSATQLFGINDSGKKGTGEIFSLTLKGSKGTYKTLYALKAKLGTKFYSVAPTGQGQYVGSAFAKTGDGLTLNIIKNAKGKLAAKKIVANTGAFEQISEAPNSPMFWEVAPADIDGNPSTANSFSATGGKYKAQSQATIPPSLYPLEIYANDDGSAYGRVVDTNIGTESLVNFSSGLTGPESALPLATR